MKISKKQVEIIKINGLDDLDPLTVVVEDFSPGQGGIIIKCYDDAWSFYWGAMGEQHDLMSFFIKAGEDYLVNKLCRYEATVTDFAALPEVIIKAIEVGITEGTLESLSESDIQDIRDEAHYMDDEAYVMSESGQDLLLKVFGEDYSYGLPEKPNHRYEHMKKIVNVVKDAFKELSKPEIDIPSSVSNIKA